MQDFQRMNAFLLHSIATNLYEAEIFHERELHRERNLCMFDDIMSMYMHSCTKNCPLTDFLLHGIIQMRGYSKTIYLG